MEGKSILGLEKNLCRCGLEYMYVSRFKCLLHCLAKSGTVIIICWYSIDGKKKKYRKIYIYILITDQNGARFEEET